MALENAQQVLACAEALSQFAEATQERLIDLRSQNRISDSEVEKIQRRNQRIFEMSDDMTNDAIEMIIANLNESQTALEGVIGDAKAAVAQIQQFRNFIDLVADVVALAAAVVTAKPGPVVSALGEIRKDLAALSSS